MPVFRRYARLTVIFSLLLLPLSLNVRAPASAAPLRASRLVPHHVFLIVLENKEYNPSQDPPYLARLEKQGALATRSYGITHPSLPNYLAMISGSTHGITNDCTGCVVHGRTLVDQLESAHLSWAAYMEDMPHSCFTGSVFDRYAKKHDPFMYIPSIRGNSVRCARVRPLTGLIHDLSGRSAPQFVWITPNLCHDGHDCGNPSVNIFLQTYVPKILRSAAYRDRGALIITYDEGTTRAGCCRLAAGGHIETIVVGTGIKKGSRIATPVDHYSLLRSIEDAFRLPHLGGAACRCTAPLVASWSR